MLFVAACGTSDGAAPDDLASLADDPAEVTAPTAPTAPTEIAEPTAVGDPGQPEQAAPAEPPMPAPSLDTGGTSTVHVTTSLTGSGLQLDGGLGSSSYALATYLVAVGGTGATGELTVNPAAGAAFTYALRGTGGGYSSRHLRLKREPGSDTLLAVSTNGSVACGPLPSGRATAVTVSFDGVANTFDVLIAGAPTACTDLPTRMRGPVTGFRVTDETIAGYGGHVEVTGLALFGT